jgi:hypothetical protein
MKEGIKEQYVCVGLNWKESPCLTLTIIYSVVLIL